MSGTTEDMKNTNTDTNDTNAGYSRNVRDAVIDAFMTEDGKRQLYNHQFLSYHQFMDKSIPDKIYSYNPIVMNHVLLDKKKKKGVGNGNGNVSKKQLPEKQSDAPVKSIRLEIWFENHRYTDPVHNELNGKTKIMFPHDARVSELTYCVDSMVDMRINCDFLEDGCVVKSQKDILLERQQVGRIPIMVGSKYCMLQKHKDDDETKKECKFDKGGYMIINGNEKVIISQEYLRDNRMNVLESKKGVNMERVCTIKSVHPHTLVSYKFDLFTNNTGGLCVKIPHIRKNIPLFIFMRALGYLPDKKMIQILLLDKYNDPEYSGMLMDSIEEARGYYTQENALQYVSSQFTLQMKAEQKIEYVKYFLLNNVLPHLGEGVHVKQLFIGSMVRRLLDYMLGKNLPDDRDDYRNKCIKLPGMLMTQLYYYFFQKMVKILKDSIVKAMDVSWFMFVPDRSTMKLKNSVINNGYRFAISTGDWNVKLGNSFNRLKGVVQLLNRLNNLGTLSHLRRISTPIEKKTVKITKPRQLHGTNLGKLCPAETPEGDQVGAVKNMTLANSVTIDTIVEPIISSIGVIGGVILPDDFVTQGESMSSRDMGVLHINGAIHGFHPDPYEMKQKLISIRRKGGIPHTTSIYYDYRRREVHINTEAGRCYRPFLIVSGNKLTLSLSSMESILKKEISWNDLVSGGMIEYMDSDEENVSMIALNTKDLNTKSVSYTHCEIGELFIMMGVCASLIPFSDHNQSPRNSYQSSMCKQAIGMYTSNHHSRFDTNAYVLSYPQLPLVRTSMSKYLGYDDLPCGQNIMVAFGCWSGYNQEDSVIFNKSAIDRGLFQCFTLRTTKAEEKRRSSTMIEENFCNPLEHDIISDTQVGKYSKLNEHGFVDLETEINGDDVIIGKVSPMTIETGKKREVVFKDNSTSLNLKPGQTGKIDDVVMTRNTDGYKIYKVKFRELRTPVVGDKVSSRSGQKGTIGMVYNQEDMPVSEDGVVPDMIINSHALPSRMTIGQLIETLLGDYTVKTGDTTLGDASAFESLSVSDIEKQLHSHGYDPVGNKTMINGQTGEEMECQMFMGPTYYQRLKHMVNDKIHARARGPVQNLTRQPVEGRSRSGGGRLGEMERDVFLSHGATHFLRERMYDCSDPFSIWVCDTCHKSAVVCPVSNEFTENPIYKCHKCKNMVNFSKIDIPYATKTFFQEIESFGVDVKIITE
jgi:DNA-directed RNA polymerase II subunit RPB2